MKKIDRIIDIVRSIKEDAVVVSPTMSLGAGKIAGTVQAGDDPPVDLRRRNTKGWNIFFKSLVKQQRKKEK
jgi:hypothetical protein